MSGKIFTGLFVVALTLVGAQAAWAQGTTPTTKPVTGNSVAPGGLGAGFAGAPAFQAPNVRQPAPATVGSPAVPAAQPAALTAGLATPAPASTPAPAAAAVPARTGASTVQWFAGALVALLLGFLFSLYARPVGAHARRGGRGLYVANWREIARR